MKIKKLNATFGKLNGDSLSFNDGLNVITAPNESGKTTWCAFIKAMLYGVDSSERQKAGYLPDKLRYAPWSGASMQGEMELEADGKDITLSRHTRLKNFPMREFSATLTGTNIPVEGLDGTNAGQLLTGVSKDVFRKSAMIEQGSIAVTGSPELEKRISAIVSTGEEGVSFTEADEQLRAWQRARRYNRRGMLPELETRMSETESKLRALETSAEESAALTERLERSKQRCNELEQAMTESRKNARRDALNNLSNVRKEMSAANAEHGKAEAECSARRAELCGSVIGERTPEEVNATVGADKKRALELKAVSEKKASAVGAYICMLLGAVLMLAAVLFIPENIKIFAFIAAAVLFVISIVGFVKYNKTVAVIADASAERQKILAKYKAESEADIEAALEEYHKLYEAYTSSVAEEKRTAKLLETARRRQESCEERTLRELDFNSGSNEAVQLGRELSAAQAECERLSAQLSELKGRVDGVGDPLVLGSKLKNMQQEHETISREYEAIALAVSTLHEADTEIQSRFSPELGKLAAQYMSLVTDGRYEAVSLNRDFSAKTKLTGDTVSREAEFMSAGTLDLMYLAVRLAVCTLALPEDANCPLIIDDALVNLDPERSEKALKLLEEIAKTRQVILFTCK